MSVNRTISTSRDTGDMNLCVHFSFASAALSHRTWKGRPSFSDGIRLSRTTNSETAIMKRAMIRGSPVTGYILYHVSHASAFCVEFAASQNVEGVRELDSDSERDRWFWAGVFAETGSWVDSRTGIFITA